MEFGKTFTLIPEENFSKHVLSKKKMSEFDAAMSKILNSTIPDHEKVRLYHDLLKRKMNLEEFNTPSHLKQPDKSEKKEPTKQENSEPVVSHKQEHILTPVILSSIHRHMKRQAESLLEFIKISPQKFEWDQSGEISYQGKKFEGSNIIDLFNLIFSTNGRSTIHAQTELLQALEDMHIPKHFIKNKHLSFSTKQVMLPESLSSNVAKTGNRRSHHKKAQHGWGVKTTCKWNDY